MSAVLGLLAETAGALAIVCASLFAALRRADELVLRPGEMLAALTADPDGPRRVVDGLLGPNQSALALTGRALLYSAATLAVTMTLYVVLTPGFAAQLAGNGFARAAVLRHLLANGLPLVFLVTLVAFARHAARQRPVPRGVFRLLAIDILAKVGLFLVLFLLMHVAYAEFRGLFGGRPGTALRAGLEAFALALRFRDIACAYLFAVALSSLPIIIAAVIALMAQHQRAGGAVGATLAVLRLAETPIRSLGLALGVLLVLLAVIGRLAPQVVDILGA